MECKETLKLLNAYVDELLSWKENEVVDQHLKACSDCDCEYHQLKSPFMHVQLHQFEASLQSGRYCLTTSM